MDFAANSGLIDINTARTSVRHSLPPPKSTCQPSDRTATAANARFIGRQHRTANQMLIEWQLLTVARPAEAAATRGKK